MATSWPKAGSEPSRIKRLPANVRTRKLILSLRGAAGITARGRTLPLRAFPTPHPVKITLNTRSIPESRRPQVEALVKSFAKATEIVWLPSRFPRFVMLVEPGPEDKSQAENGSIFESPLAGTRSLASVTEFLEVRIKDCLAGPGA